MCNVINVGSLRDKKNHLSYKEITREFNSSSPVILEKLITKPVPSDKEYIIWNILYKQKKAE